MDLDPFKSAKVPHSLVLDLRLVCLTVFFLPFRVEISRISTLNQTDIVEVSEGLMLVFSGKVDFNVFLLTTR